LDGLSKLLPEKKSLRGCPRWLDNKGLIGLMFLKHYTGLSDEKLLERFHTDWGMQLFVAPYFLIMNASGTMLLFHAPAPI